MTNGIRGFMQSGGRQRPPLTRLFGIVFAAMLGFGVPLTVFAHAEPERASPPIGGVVETVPSVVEIWFTEKVKTDGTTIQVIGPGGIQVDLSDAKVDLDDPNRKHVTVSLRSGLGSGAYTVQWTSVSVEDGDSAQGGYLFTVGGATPVASPVATPGAAPADAEQQADMEPSSGVEPMATVEIVGTPVTNLANEKGNFDSRAFGLSVGAGLIAAILIFIFWRAVRPKDPRFRE